ncbi:glycerate kinase type-2 family protein [Novosphingobium terrae]|uniref:glycerate kinase type-2 family protein n=1 Tax=Novosphingobium terrae TaxID=2726189 RepID=UPI0019826E86|nr:glycerate kinase [Novosphingobium terrae]
MNTGSNPDALLRGMFGAAVEAALPVAGMARVLPAHDGPILVLGAGKAAASMAAALEASLPDADLTGLVVTRYGHKVPTSRIDVVEASHPVPDAAGEAAAQRILDLAKGATVETLVVFLISGGASALLSLPAPGLTLADKQAVNVALLKSGAPISAMNGVRKHLSAIKGGQLAAAAFPARSVTLVISDVPGDDPSEIGSGPTVADPTTFADALATIERYNLNLPPCVIRQLSKTWPETPKPGDERLRESEVHIVASPQMALEAAAGFARDHGIEPVILGDAIEGEASEVAVEMARDALSRRPAKPLVLLSGGETTVTIRGESHGRGGRNSEFLLALGLALDGAPHIHAIACDTDGIDGSEDNAGAIIGPDFLARCRDRGVDPQASLQRNDAYGVFEALGDLVMTGPTLTNVNDFRAILILPD